LRMAKYVHKIICDFPTMHGIYNVSSTSITKYELINLFNSLFKKGTMIYQDNSYTSNKELDSTKFFKETGFEKPNWKELAEELFIDSESNLKYYK